MTVIKSRLVKSECSHHGITDFYDYGSHRVCATCAREKKRVRDAMKRVLENKPPVKEKVAKPVRATYSLTEYFIDKYKPTIDSIIFIYKIKFSKSKLIKGVGVTVTPNQFLTKMKQYYYDRCKCRLISEYGWKHSTVLKYRYNVRDNYNTASDELKERIRKETYELANQSIVIPLQVLKDRVDALPIIKDDSVVRIKEEKKEVKPKQEVIFHPKLKIPDEITGFIGVKRIHQKRCKSEDSYYFIAIFKGKQIGFYETAEEAAIAYNNEVIKAYGDYAVSGGLLNKVNKETTYLGCKGVTLKNGKYVSRLEFKGKEVYNKSFDDFETAIREYDKEVVKYFGKDSDKLNYKIVSRTITTCTNIPKTIKKRIKKNKPSSWLVTFRGTFLGTFTSELDACLAYNKAVMESCGEDCENHLIKIETSQVRERVKVQSFKNKDMIDITPEQKKSLGETIGQYDVSRRTYNCLKAANVETYADLVVFTEYDLMNLKNFGVKCLSELKYLVKEKKLSLGMDL